MSQQGEETREILEKLQVLARYNPSWDTHQDYLYVHNNTVVFTGLLRDSHLIGSLPPGERIAVNMTDKNLSFFVSELPHLMKMDALNKTELVFQAVVNDSKLILVAIERFIAMDVAGWDIRIETQSMFSSIPASLWWGFVTITTGLFL